MLRIIRSLPALASPSFRVPAIIAAFALLIFIVAAAPSANAATFSVTTITNSGAGSLRQAVLDANAATTDDTITFNIPAANCTAAGVCTVTLASEITIANNGSLTINGTGANRLTISGNNASRIFYSNAATFTVSGATLTQGSGAGASNSGSGGAIYASGGTLALRGVNITGNTVSGGGVTGGVYFNGGANHQITNSTFSNNNGLSGGCGGFYNNSGGTLTVTNTTVSGNMTTGVGGGFCNNGTITVRNSTIAGNTGGTGGGIYSNGGTLTLGNTIVAGNTDSGGKPDINNPSNTLTTTGYNLIGDNTNATTAFPAGNPNANNDLVGTTAAPINAQLAPLAFNGGIVPTRALCTASGVPNVSCTGASPAIDKGSLVSGVSLDGRGVIRPFDNPLTANATGGNGADIGAFELETAIVKAAGYNQFGQLGIGSTTDQAIPQTLSGGSDYTQFGGGFQHSIALRSDGSVVTAGNDANGQLGDGTIGGGNRTTFAPVTVGGNVINITQVSGGLYHNLALRSDGTVWAWGDGADGQLGNGASSASATPVQVQAVGAFAAGFNGRVIAVSAGAIHSLALTDDGKVWAWGSNNRGQLGDGTGTNRNRPQPVKVSVGGADLTGIIQISAGEYHNAAIRTDGSVLSWGYNANGQVGNGTSVSSILLPTQTTAAAMGTVVQVSAGAYHTVAVNTAGDVYAWGQGSSGQIGDNNTANALTPRKSGTVGAPLANIVRVEAHGAYYNLARRRDGTLFAWGYNAVGEIGNGTTTQQNEPLNISAAAGTGGNLGTNIAVFGAGTYTNFTSTAPEMTTPAGASTLRGDNFSVAFPALTIAGTTQVRTFDPTATGLTAPSGFTVLANSTGYDITTTSTFPGLATVCLTVPNVIDLTTFNNLYILHDDDLDGTLDAGGGRTHNYQKRQVCRVTASFSPFVIALGPAAPTAASVTVSGRVTVGKGSGLINAVVSLTDSEGNTRTARTTSFGYYYFDDVQGGQTYIVSIQSKRYWFDPQFITVTEDNTDVNFAAQ